MKKLLPLLAFTFLAACAQPAPAPESCACCKQCECKECCCKDGTCDMCKKKGKKGPQCPPKDKK